MITHQNNAGADAHQKKKNIHLSKNIAY